MKKLLLSITIFFAVSAAYSQSCTPGANYADSTFGAWPDTIQNFPGATENVAYSTDLNFKVPLNASDVQPNTPGTIQNFTVTNVVGLPAGLNYACNIGNCTYNGGTNGCANIYGTPTTPGTYDIQIEVSANVYVFPITIPYPYTFTGYKIVVSPSTASMTELENSLYQIYPNPANDQLTFVNHSKGKIQAVQVIHMDGRIIESTPIIDNQITFDISNYHEGIYFLKVIKENEEQTFKWIKNK